LLRTVKDLVPNLDVKLEGQGGSAGEKNAPLDLSMSKAELGYTPKFPLKEALKDYMEELWSEAPRT
jgi:nucleoside-diphosphate-sugar epimerase